MNKSAVEYLVEEFDLEMQDTFHLEKINKAKEMENQHNIYLLEWIRENAVEVQEGWQYLGKAYTDKQIIEIYNQTFKSK